MIGNTFDRLAEIDAERPLAGRPGWLICDDRVGVVVQARGVADALGLVSEHKLIVPDRLQKLIAPWCLPPRSAQVGVAGSPFGPPWPAAVIAIGRYSVPYIRRIRRLAGRQTFVVLLQDPKAEAGVADLIWVPDHDKRRGPNVFTTLTAPHSFTQNRLVELRESVPGWIARLPAPRVAVVLGGKNAVFDFSEAADLRLAAGLKSLAKLGASFLITPSRRTHERLREVVDEATRDAPRFFWDGAGDNPYPHILAHADAFVVTADSVNMTGEACSTGKPVYVFHPEGGSPKFRYFHEELERAGATRPFPAELSSLEAWSYEPIDASRAIAAEIERRWRLTHASG